MGCVDIMPVYKSPIIIVDITEQQPVHINYVKKNQNKIIIIVAIKIKLCFCLVFNY